MKEFVFTFGLSFLTILGVKAQMFPQISAESVTGKTLEIPTALNGTKSIVFLAFTAEAENKLKQWYEPVYMMFLDQSGFNAMAYDCEIKLMMMFTGASQGAANKIIDNIKKNVDPSMAEMLLFYQGSFSEQMNALGLKKKDDCYVFVLDENGKILLQETGNYSESKLDKIASLVEL